MSTGAGRLAFGLVGAAIGSFTPIGGSGGFIVGSLIGNLVFPSEDSIITTSGPRLGDLSVTSSAYGAPRPIGFGTVRMGGNIIWSDDIEEIRTVSREDTGQGKGGVSGAPLAPTQEHATYTYFLTWAIAFGEGPAADITRIWANGKLIFDKRAANPDISRVGFNFRFYPGNDTQLPDPDIQAKQTVARTPAFRNTVYIVIDRLALADYGNTRPNITAEVVYESTDVRLSTDATLISGGTLNSYQADMLGVDWDRQLSYLVDQVPVGVANINVNGIRRINRVSGTEDRQAIAADIFDQTIATTVGGEVIHVAPDGSLIHTAFDTNTTNSAPIVRIDSNTLTETARFGAGSATLDYRKDGFEVTTEYANISLFGQTGRADYILCKSTFNSLGILGPLPGLDFVWATDLFVSDGAGGTGLPEVDVMSICGGKIAEGFGNGYALAGPLYSTPQSGNVVLYKITVSQNAGFSVFGGVDISEGVGFDIVKSFTVGDLVPGETALQITQGLIYDPNDDSVIFHTRGNSDSQNYIIKASVADGTILWRTAVSIGLNDPRINAGRLRGGHTFGYIRAANGVLIDTNTGTLLFDDVAPDYTSTTDITDLGYYDGRSETWVGVEATEGTSRWFFNRSTGLDANLGNIVETIAGRVNLVPADLDTTAITGTTFPGYVIGRQTSARAAIELLTTIFFFDGVENDFVLDFIFRGQASTRTITQDELVIVDETTGEFFKENKVQEVELPEKISIFYIDKGLDYQQNVQSVKRIFSPVPAMRSQNRLGLNTAAVLNADFVKQQAEKALYSLWTERNNYDFRLPWKHIDLNPTDVIDISLDIGLLIQTRILQFDIGGGLVLDINGVGEEVDQFVSTSTASAAEGFPVQNVRATEFVKTILLDIPLLLDAHEPSGRVVDTLYAFMGGYNEGSFRRGVLFKSADAVSFTGLVTLTSEMAWGSATNALGDPPFDNPFETDETNTLTVVMNTGGTELQSVTKLQMLNGANAAALLKANGEVEIIKFQNVTANSDGSFTLDTFLRGRRGTDTMTNSHTVGEIFVLLNTIDGELFTLTLAEINTPLFYRGVGSDQLFDDAELQTLTSKHRALMPYAPTLVTAVEDVSNNIDIAWVRRTRVGGAMVDLVGTVPLNEDSEEYEIDIYEATGTTIVQTATGLTTPAYEYLNADIITDFGAVPATLIIEVFQISAQVGRGFTKRVTVEVE